MKRLLSLCFACFVSLCGCTNKEVNARQRIKDITNVNIPTNSTMEYNHIDSVFVHGRLPQYTVFKFEEKPVDFLSYWGFSNGRSTSFEEGYSRDIDFLTINISDIPSQYQPNWEREYLYFFLFYKCLFYIFYRGSITYGLYCR